VRAALDLGVERELVVRNVAHSARDRPRLHTQAIPRAWTAEELRSFLAEARDQRLYAALHIAAYTGVRRGERSSGSSGPTSTASLHACRSRAHYRTSAAGLLSSA
jgi:hypothetical protein